ncbi:hypothetical protein BDZ85DRAFT_256364 [Elsinoe ampelina]|uniref:BTB domain-containing protein n=1 Tax=Elsinoe ampelina TaxID=302913 RepID=A0A6A6GMJ0_9PEZI|nr:hypothetical protein BDZ85DRAFT_256364 [Elsinoe ampelina]
MDSTDFLKVIKPNEIRRPGCLVVKHKGQKDTTSNIEILVVEEACPLLAASFEPTARGIEACYFEEDDEFTPDAAKALLRYSYTLEYLPAHCQDPTKTPLTTHLQVYRIAHNYDAEPLRDQAYMSVVQSLESSCYTRQRPLDLIAAVRYAYKYYQDDTKVLSSLLGYCATNLVQHDLLFDREFIDLLNTHPVFHQDLCVANMSHVHRNEGAQTFVQVGVTLKTAEPNPFMLVDTEHPLHPGRTVCALSRMSPARRALVQSFLCTPEARTEPVPEKVKVKKGGSEGLVVPGEDEELEQFQRFTKSSRFQPYPTRSSRRSEQDASDVAALHDRLSDLVPESYQQRNPTSKSYQHSGSVSYQHPVHMSSQMPPGAPSNYKPGWHGPEKWNLFASMNEAAADQAAATESAAAEAAVMGLFEDTPGTGLDQMFSLDNVPLPHALTTRHATSSSNHDNECEAVRRFLAQLDPVPDIPAIGTEVLPGPDKATAPVVTSSAPFPETQDLPIHPAPSTYGDSAPSYLSEAASSSKAPAPVQESWDVVDLDPQPKTKTRPQDPATPDSDMVEVSLEVEQAAEETDEGFVML